MPHLLAHSTLLLVHNPLTGHYFLELFTAPLLAPADLHCAKSKLISPDVVQLLPKDKQADAAHFTASITMQF